MKCPDSSCSNIMEHRNGKFGGFWYCPQHGTISDKGIAIIEKLPSLVEVASYSFSTENDPLMHQIHRQTMDFGVRPSELEEWIVDDEGAADYEEDHWMNLRPY